ncbi:MAG: response regulator [Deltaproteobacteria bacterium]|jgi:CheY-like chemotaxis protein|nr:response regulator [Deltaproteobacteria bacterium]MBW2532915.1 response regulator [Deltaproteobacteria bacterium]
MTEDKKTILVVDDEPDVVTFISTVLTDHGYATVTAKDGVEALQRVEERRPDLISLDITMPEKSGVKFYREMRESDEYKDIPIVIVTGISDEFQKFISTRRQVPPPDGYLSKPIGAEDVLGAVRKILG